MIAARQIFLGRGGGAKLPYDAEVEYLESTGTQWIDTGIYPTSNIGAYVDFLITGRVGTYGSILGVGNDTWRWGVGYRTTGVSLQINGLCYQGPSWENYSVAVERTELLYNFTNDKKCYRNGSLLRDDIPYGSVVSPVPIWLFAFSNGVDETLWRASALRIYSCQMTDNGITIRDFIPVRFNNELGQSEGAMYDRVSRQLFRNQGTGAFSYGPDK